MATRKPLALGGGGAGRWRRRLARAGVDNCCASCRDAAHPANPPCSRPPVLDREAADHLGSLAAMSSRPAAAALCGAALLVCATSFAAARLTVASITPDPMRDGSSERVTVHMEGVTEADLTGPRNSLRLRWPNTERGWSTATLDGWPAAGSAPAGGKVACSFTRDTVRRWPETGPIEVRVRAEYMISSELGWHLIETADCARGQPGACRILFPQAAAGSEADAPEVDPHAQQVVAAAGGASLHALMRTLPSGPKAPVVVPARPRPYFSWDRIPSSFHGANKRRKFSDKEVERLAKFQMLTIEKWYTGCASKGPVQSGPDCAVELKTEHLYSRTRAINPNQTTILYWNSMFDFSFYAAHQQMIDMEQRGLRSYLRDKNDKLIGLCNDGNGYCNITTFDWTQPHVRALWIQTVMNATATGLVDGIYADHSGTYGNGINIGAAGKDSMGPNQLCNGNGKGRECFNFTADFKSSFNSWHDWATNYTQDMLSNTTGGPVLQGPYATMGDVDACDFEAIRNVQKNGHHAGPKSSGPILHVSVSTAKPHHKNTCKPSTSCLAAFLAAAEPYTYLHCGYNDAKLLSGTSYPEMDYYLGAPHGLAIAGPAGVWTRLFGGALHGGPAGSNATVVVYNSGEGPSTIEWGNGQGRGPAPAPPPGPGPSPAPTPGPVPHNGTKVCPKVYMSQGMRKANVGQVEAADWSTCCGRCAARIGCTKWSWAAENHPTECHLHGPAAKMAPSSTPGKVSGIVVRDVES